LTRFVIIMPWTQSGSRLRINPIIRLPRHGCVSFDI